MSCRVTYSADRAFEFAMLSTVEPLPRFVPLDRMLAFSDGVFAVVITLLVLGIEIPSDAVLTGSALVMEREKILHQLFIYFVAFWLVGMYWSQQSLFTSGLKQIDRGTFVLNLLLLLPITLLPFVTQFMGTMRADWRAVLLFALVNVFATLVLVSMWSRIAALPEISQEPSDSDPRCEDAGRGPRSRGCDGRRCSRRAARR